MEAGSDDFEIVKLPHFISESVMTGSKIILSWRYGGDFIVTSVVPGG